MEDAHIATLNFNDNPDLHLFGVFDGHGGIHFSFYFYSNLLIIFKKGKEVADYCKENFENVLKADPLIKTDVA